MEELVAGVEGVGFEQLEIIMGEKMTLNLCHCWQQRS